MAINYYVNEQKGTVVAVLTDTELDAAKCIVKTVGCFDIGIGETKKGIILENKYIGKAKCDTRDIFSLDVGKKIAKKKCMDKYYKAKDSAVNDWMLRAKENISKVEDYINKKTIYEK